MAYLLIGGIFGFSLQSKEALSATEIVKESFKDRMEKLLIPRIFFPVPDRDLDEAIKLYNDEMEQIKTSLNKIEISDSQIEVKLKEIKERLKLLKTFSEQIIIQEKKASRLSFYLKSQNKHDRAVEDFEASLKEISQLRKEIIPGKLDACLKELRSGNHSKEQELEDKAREIEALRESLQLLVVDKELDDKVFQMVMNNSSVDPDLLKELYRKKVNESIELIHEVTANYLSKSWSYLHKKVKRIGKDSPDRETFKRELSNINQKRELILLKLTKLKEMNEKQEQVSFKDINDIKNRALDFQNSLEIFSNKIDSFKLNQGSIFAEKGFDFADDDSWEKSHKLMKYLDEQTIPRLGIYFEALNKE